MKLTDLLPLGKEEKREFYWSLVIEAGWVQAGIWTIENGVASVVSISPGAAWEVDEDLTRAADAALSAAIQNLPEEFGEPQKTVFGLPNSWISEGQIKEEYLAKIKKICTELSLEPSGFVVISEAIAHLVKSEEGAPANAVILGIGKEVLEISVFKLGVLSGSSEVARSVSLAEDAIEGLARFPKTESFPSRFLIYDGKEGELEEAKQALLDTSWDEHENIKFLHTPKIEIINPDRKILATSLAGASEIAQVSKVSEVVEEAPKEISKEEENIIAPKEEVTPEELGFVVGADISEEVPQRPQLQVDKKEPEVSQPPIRRRIPKLNFGKIFKLKPKLPSFGGKNTLTLSIAVATVFLALFLGWWFLPTARVNIYISPKILEETQELTIDTKSSTSDFPKAVIAGRVLESQSSGEKTVSTTGSKLVGEKATGAVRIQNGLAAPINLPAGTVLSSSNDLKFTTTNAASVSAALSPASPGVANVDVVAGSIGAEYNLAKDEAFKVGNYPKADVDAVSVSDFTGGSSRQITAVSLEDTEKLEKELTEELVNKAKEGLSGQISPDETFAGGGLTAKAVSREFSHKVGDEADNLKLALTVSVTTFAVNRSELFEYSKEILKDKIPSGYTLTQDEIEVDFEIKSEERGVYDVAAVISARLLPEIAKSEIIQKISGKYPKLVESFLVNSIPGFTRAEIRINPPLPGFLGTLPHVAKRINVEVQAER